MNSTINSHNENEKLWIAKRMGWSGNSKTGGVDYLWRHQDVHIPCVLWCCSWSKLGWDLRRRSPPSARRSMFSSVVVTTCPLVALQSANHIPKPRVGGRRRERDAKREDTECKILATGAKVAMKRGTSSGVSLQIANRLLLWNFLFLGSTYVHQIQK